MKVLLIKIIKKLLGIPIINPKTKIEVLKEKGLKVGENFNMQDECIIDDSHCWHISIGDNVTLAPRVHILAHDASTKMPLNYAKIGNVNIGNNVFIGAGSIILPTVNIGNFVIIGAGSIVTKDIPDNSVVAGNPAKLICSFQQYIEKQKNLMNDENCFDETYTLRKDINIDKKQFMIRMVQKHGIGFVN